MSDVYTWWKTPSLSFSNLSTSSSPSWVKILSSPVSVVLDLSRPQTSLIGRKTDVSEGG